MKRILKFYKDNKVLLIATFVFSIITFGYFGVNNIINNDGVLDLIIDSSSNADYRLYLSVGRYGWALIGSIFKFYPSPFLYLILNSVMFSITSVYINRLFNVTDIKKQIILSMIFISFPLNAVAYSYSAWQCSLGIGMFLSVYSVYLINKSSSIKEYIISALIMSFAISIYQIFISIILILLLFITINKVKDLKPKEVFIKLGKYALTFIGAGIIYAIMVKLSTFIFQINMNEYQNANEMFSFNIKDIFDNLLYSILHCIYQHKIQFYSTVGHVVLILTTILSYISLLKTNKNKKLIYTFLYICLLAAPQFLRFFKPYQYYHNITFIPYGILYTCGLAILFKNINCIKKIEKYIIGLLIITISIFVIDDNRAGVMARNTTNAAYNFANRLQYRIESTPGYSDIIGVKKYYFAGGYKDFWEFPYSERAYVKTLGITTNFVFNPSGMVDAINVLGIDAVYYNDLIDSKTRNEIDDLVKNRDIYPSIDSIFIYKDIVVINYSNLNTEIEP